MIAVMIYPKKSKAFTLIELLVVLAISAILVAIAVPSFDQTVKRNSVRGLQKSYLGALSYARGEAVARNKLVSICPSSDAETCGASWSGGWLVFIDNGDGANFGNGVYDAPQEQLLRVNEYEGRSTVRVQDPDDGFNALDRISWTFRGFTQDNIRALIVVCDRDNDAASARALLVERSGRVIQSRDLDNDGIHESSFEGEGQRDLTCS